MELDFLLHELGQTSKTSKWTVENDNTRLVRLNEDDEPTYFWDITWMKPTPRPWYHDLNLFGHNLGEVLSIDLVIDKQVIPLNHCHVVNI